MLYVNDGSHANFVFFVVSSFCGPFFLRTVLNIRQVQFYVELDAEEVQRTRRWSAMLDREGFVVVSLVVLIVL